MPRTLDPREVPGLLRPGMRVYVAGGTNEPATLIEALRDAPGAAAGVTFVQSTVPGLNDTDLSALDPSARALAYFITPATAAAHRAGRVDFLPMQLSRVCALLAETPFDLALVQLAPTDDPAHHCQGLNADFLDCVLPQARCVVAEVNRAVPAPPSSPRVAVARLDYVVDSEQPMPTLPLPPESDEARRIGAHVAELVDDGDCIQTGIGSIPFAVLAALGTKNDLGLHSGILDDAGQRLIEAGVITGRRKTIDRGKAVYPISTGSAAFYAWAAGRPDLELRPVSYTHHVPVIAGIDGFVSVNSAMEIDLGGQLNAEMIRGRQVTGTGGSVDFMRGAALSKGGRSIIAMTATASGGKLSRIVPRLGGGNAATALRTDIDYVVTEHGAARLRFLPQRARAEALIEIADPRFRDALRDALKETFR